MQLQLQEGKIICGTFASGLLLLLATGLSCSALFLAFWDGGSAKELLNLEDAPPVVSTLWSISFNNPPPQFVKPARRDPSTWDDYCAAQSKKPKNGPSASSSFSEVNGTAVDSSTATGGKVSNVSNATGANRSGSRRLRPQEDDPPLPNAACFLVTTSRVMMLLSPSFSTAAFITMVVARMRMSVLSTLLGAFFSGLSAAAACSAVMLAALVSIAGLASGLGTQFVFLAMCFAIAAACIAMWASAKAVQPLPGVMRAAGGEAESDSEEEMEAFKARRKSVQEVKSKQTAGPDSDLRLDKMRKAHKREIRKIQNAPRRSSVDDTRRSSTYGAGNTVTVSEEKMMRINHIIDSNAPINLKRIFQWGERKGEGGRFGSHVPDELIEDAFREIDEDESGEISLDEFMMAVRRLGLEPSKEAFQAILVEVDKDASGTLDYKEFYSFFRTMEEAIKEGENKEHQGACFSGTCHLCLIVHLIIISVTVIASSRRPPTTEKLSERAQSERDLIDMLIRIIGVNLCILFWCVVGLPMLKFTLGRSIALWTTIAAEALSSCCRRCRRIVPEQAEVEPDASDVEMGKHSGEVDDHVGKHSKEVGDHGELPALREPEEIDSPSMGASSPPTVPCRISVSSKGPKGKRKRSSTAPGNTGKQSERMSSDSMQGGDMATAQQGHLRKNVHAGSRRTTSSPWWSSLFGRRGKETRKSHIDSGQQLPGASRRPSIRRTSVTSANGVSVEHLPNNKRRTSVTSVNGKRRTSVTSPTGRQRRRSSVGIKKEDEWTGEMEGQYDPALFQEASRIYVEAISAPVSSFTPMQVRNISYQPPDLSIPVPPAETHVPNLFLPGMTDASFHGRQFERSGSHYSQ